MRIIVPANATRMEEPLRLSHYQSMAALVEFEGGYLSYRIRHYDRTTCTVCNICMR